jgi:hypothetical protein
MNHTYQDSLAVHEIQEHLNGIHGVAITQITRLASGDHQVYKYTDENDIPRVVKIAGKGHERDKKILTEIETIYSLHGIVKVPEILCHGLSPKPYFIMPWYQQKNDVNLEEADAYYQECIYKLNSLKKCSFPRINFEKIRYALYAQKFFYNILINKRLTKYFPDVKSLLPGIRQIIMKDQMIYGQYKPGDLLVTDEDHVFVDWAEGLGFFPINKQIALLVFWDAIWNPEKAIRRVEKFRNGFSKLGIQISLSSVRLWWDFVLLEYAVYLYGQIKTIEILELYGSYYHKLTEHFSSKKRS